MNKVEWERRLCAECQVIRPITDFQRVRGGIRRVCKLCAPRRNYGRLCGDHIEFLLKKQNGCCAICGKLMKKPCLDHNHKTGVSRELLCSNCNTGIGMFEEDVLRMEAAITYLRLHNNCA